MRVTKLIREYVEKAVEAKYPKSVEELAWENEGKRMNEAITEADKRVEAFAKEVAKELNLEYGFAEDYCLTFNKHYSPVSNKYYGDSEIYKAYRKAQNERCEKIRKAIDEILISLELGGTKADLDEMLSKIGQ